MKSALLMAMALATPATAASVTLPLLPATTQVEGTVYVFGMVPVTGTFGDFSGSVSTDASLQDCRVRATVRLASLHIGDPLSTSIALGRGMLDAAHYPTLEFSGRCIGGNLTGEATLHGISRTLVLTLRHDTRQVVATGTVQRGDYGIYGLPGLVGQSIRIRLQTTLPQSW